MQTRALTSILIAWFAVACAAAPRSPITEPRTDERGSITLDAMDSDVWAFERVITGTASESCAYIEIERTSSHDGTMRIEAEQELARFRAVVPLREGENQVRARCASAHGERIPSRIVHWRVRLSERPMARLRVMTLPDSLAVDLGGSAPSSVSLSPITRMRFRVSPENPEILEDMSGAPLSNATTMRVRIRLPTHDGDYTVTGEIIDAAGRSNLASVRFTVEDGRTRTMDPMDEHARWIEHAVMYGAAPLLFDPPRLSRVRDRLDVLSSLGVDTVWLSPITVSPEGDYGYAVVDYFDVRDDYGTASDVRALIAHAHELGMHVLMDFVPSHTSNEHPYYEHTLEHGSRSPYWDFYARDERGEAQHDFDWTHLPKLNYDHPEVRHWMREAFSFWVREFGIDGFRIDAAWSLEHRAPEFLEELARHLYTMNPNLLLIAEARACDPFWQGAGFAAGYDWTNAIGRWAWHAPFRIDEDTMEVDVPSLRAAIETSDMPHCVRVVRFLDNNDTGARFISRRGRSLHDAALSLLFTLPGLPTLFTGAEMGAEYSPYERERSLSWHEDASHARAIERRIALRRSLTALHRGALVMLQVTPADSVLAFLRRDPDARQPVLVIINFSGAGQLARISLPETDMPSFISHPLYDAMNDEAISTSRARNRELTFSLEAYQARVVSSRSMR